MKLELSQNQMQTDLEKTRKECEGAKSAREELLSEICDVEGKYEKLF